jgi:hypothetical protein
MESHTEKQGKSRYSSDSTSPFEITRQRVNIKDFIVACLFIGTVGITWGAYSSKAEEQKERLTNLIVRVERNEQTTNQLIAEVVKVSRDTEWIRGYLNNKDSGKNKP